MQIPLNQEGILVTNKALTSEVKYFGMSAEEVTKDDKHLSKSVTFSNKPAEYYIRVLNGKPVDKDIKARSEGRFIKVDENLFNMYHRYCSSDNKNILLDLTRIVNMKGLI